MGQRSDTNKIIGSNIALIDRDGCSADERRLVQLYERAMFILRDEQLLFGDDRTEDFLSLFDIPQAIDDVPEEFKKHLAPKQMANDFFDKLTVCRFIAEEYEKRGDLLTGLLRCSAPRTSANIAYFRNAYADAAFRIFSDVLNNPTVTYASDFTSVCEEVYYERADMCLLPLDSSRDSKLVSFYKLIEKYDLSPVYSCDVVTPDGSVSTRYALLQKEMSVPAREVRNFENGCLFEFSLAPDNSVTLSDVLGAAKSCGMTLYKVDSLPSAHSEGTFTYDVIVNVCNACELDAFVLFMTLAVPQYEPLGIYPHIRVGE